MGFLCLLRSYAHKEVGKWENFVFWVHTVACTEEKVLERQTNESTLVKPGSGTVICFPFHWYIFIFPKIMTEMHIVEPSVPELSPFVVEIAINHQVLIKFWQHWSKQVVKYYFLRTTNLLIQFVMKKKCHSSGRNLLLYIFHEKCDKTDCRRL